MTKDKMIARRVSKGANTAQSATVLDSLIKAHEGWNLVTALVYNGFATEKMAMRFVGV